MLGLFWGLPADAQLLTADPASLSFSYEPGAAAPPRQTIKVDSSLFGVRLSPPEVTSTGNWLSAALSFQSTPDVLTVTVNPSSLPPGRYQGTITVSSPSAPTLLTKTIPVDLDVGSTVSLQYQLGFPAAAPVCFGADLAPGASPAVTSGPPSWLMATVDPTSARRVCVSINPAGLTPGTFTGRITVPGPSGSTSIAVNLSVAAAPAVSVSVTSLSFTHQLGAREGPPPQVLSIASERPAAGVRFMSATAGDAGGRWLRATADSEATPARLSVSADPAGLAPGNYRGTVTVTFSTAPENPVVVAVNLTVLGLRISPSPSSLTFVYETGSSPTPQQVAVTAVSATGESLPWTYHASATEPWLTVNPQDDSAPGSVSVLESGQPGEGDIQRHCDDHQS